MSGFTIAWLVWGGYFAVVEAYAIFRAHRAKQLGHPSERGTLSEHVWAWFGTARGTHANSWAYLRRFALVAFMAWLSIHFIGGGQLV